MSNKYERHIRKLCREHDIEIRYDRVENAANMLSKIIWIKPSMKSVKSYVGALHEIGHIINEHDTIGDNWGKIVHNYKKVRREAFFTSKYIMKCEVDAWRTARKLAKWWNPTGDRVAIECLLTYMYSYNKCHKKPFKKITNKELLGKILPNLSFDKELVVVLSKLYA